MLKTLPGTVHLFENALDAGGPDERRRLGVPRFEERGDGVLQLGHAAKGAVVVEDQVQDLVARKLVVESPQEPQELLMPVAGIALADDAALHDVQRGE